MESEDLDLDNDILGDRGRDVIVIHPSTHFLRFISHHFFILFYLILLVPPNEGLGLQHHLHHIIFLM